MGTCGRKVGGRCEEGQDVEVREEAGILVLARDARQIQRFGVDWLLTKWTLENDLMSYLQEHPVSLLQRLRCTSQRKMEMAMGSSQGDGREVRVLSWTHEEKCVH